MSIIKSNDTIGNQTRDLPACSAVFFQALNFLVENFGLLNDLFPFPSILDTGYPFFYLHLADVLCDVILPSVLGSSLWSFGQGFPIKYLLNTFAASNLNF
jgi:hypothetical protein